MQIERIDHSSALPASASATKKQQPAEEIAAATDEIAPPVEETEDQAGVLRLLQEGHFKGVADVRLRINFFEELQAMESQAQLDSAADGFAAFNQALETDLNALRDSGELTEEQSAALDGFLEQIRQIQNDYDGATPFAELLAGMQTQLDNLLASLNPAPGSEEVEQPEQPPVEVEEELAALEESPDEQGEPLPQEETEAVILPEETFEEPSIFAQLVTNLRSSFEQALQQLQSDMDTPGILPPLSEPSGNGKAYAKFLAIYEGMQNGTTVPAEAAEQSEEPIAEA